MAFKKTPGVYVEEISTLPPSVAEVSTAIPAFIGYTEITDRDPSSEPGEEPKIRVRRITNMLEYRQQFGGAPPDAFTANVEPTAAGAEISLERSGTGGQYLLYYSLKLFFENGGGACYIASIGGYTEGIIMAASDFKAGLTAIGLLDEPTLLVFPDATNLGDIANYGQVCNMALDQCQELGDRFTIMDVKNSPDIFRGKIKSETEYLKYGAAYTPYLDTLIPYELLDKNITVIRKLSEEEISKREFEILLPKNENVPNDENVHFFKIDYKGDAASASVIIKKDANIEPDVDFDATTQPGQLIITVKKTPTPIDASFIELWEEKEKKDKGDFSLGLSPEATNVRILASTSTSSEGAIVASDSPENIPLTSGSPDPKTITLEKLNSTDFDDDRDTALYNQVKQALSKKNLELPPSPAIAGIYARVDRNNGVWKTPANVSISGIAGPTRVITNKEQETLNIDATSGKSINAIRSFTGKGTLVWGGRTLAGNDNEWRYISVRRLFNLIEESVRKSTSFAVFEPNDTTTWLKVKAMIESYLYGLWQQGALAGSVAEQAFFVQVGLGKTMTTQDILEGRMNIEIGLAAVRPAEFIYLKFSHKLQEA